MDEQRSLLKTAQEAIQAGRKQEARSLLQQALRQDPKDYRAWLWLAGVTKSPQASLEYVERAERLAPGNATVARARAWAERRLAAEAAQAEPRTETVSRATPTAERQPASELTAQRERRGRDGETMPPQMRTSQPSPPQTQTEERKRSRRPLVFAAGALALVTVLLLASGFIWRASNGDAVDEEAAIELAAAGDVGEATATPVSGQFAPKNRAGLAEDEEGPGPEATATPRPLEPKAMVSGKEGGGPRPTWTMTPTPTPTFTPTPTPVPTFVSGVSNPRPAERPPGVGPNERWIDVNLTAQRLVAYEGDTPVFESLVSSGTYNYPTVTGQFRIWLRFQAQTMDGRRLGYDYYLENVPYVMYFYQDYALHGTYWHNNFGTPMSHGCVNLPTPAAEWIYNWSTMGTVVNVHY